MLCKFKCKKNLIPFFWLCAMCVEQCLWEEWSWQVLKKIDPYKFVSLCMEIRVECKNIYRCFSVEAWLDMMIISRVLWACLVDFLNIKFGLLERLMCGVFLGWVIEWLEVRFVITGILEEVWIQNVDNVVLSREIISVFVVAKKFFLSRLPRL